MTSELVACPSWLLPGTWFIFRLLPGNPVRYAEIEVRLRRVMYGGRIMYVVIEKASKPLYEYEIEGIKKLATKYPDYEKYTQAQHGPN